MAWITLTFVLLATTIIQGLPQNVKERDQRIINGEPAEQGEFPSQVSLQLRGSQHCGASILNENWVLTAAHCVHRIEPSEISLLSGTIDLTSGGTSHEVVEVIQHEGYSTQLGIMNDIAVIKVSPPFDIDGVNVKPVNLPSEGENPADGSVATLIGWGRDENGNIPDILQKVHDYIINLHACRTAYAHYAPVFDSMICTLSEEEQGPCNGDSGGPVYVDGILVGVISWGNGDCGNGKYPTVCGRVSHYVSWIKEKTGV